MSKVFVSYIVYPDGLMNVFAGNIVVDIPGFSISGSEDIAAIERHISERIEGASRVVIMSWKVL